MTSAHDLLRGGDPESALQALQEQVRKEPADAKHRIFLFQLLALLGRWDRALTQLNVAGDLDPGALGMVHVYREALASEALRADVFAGQRTPLVFGDPEQWIALLIEALRVAAAGKDSEAIKLRDQAFEMAPASGGRINGAAFEWIADADMRLGPLLEAIVNGQYYWIPIHRILEIRIDEPEDLRDLIWLPAQFKWSNGGEAVGLIPARYPGSENADDPGVRTGRKTAWVEQTAGTYFGLGQRMLATDEQEYPLLEIRDVILDTASESAESD